MHYRHDLGRLCPDTRVDVLDEAPAQSRYRMRRGDSTVTVTFAERAEDRAFPTALASCFAKYVRELMVECLNRWFASHEPDLKRTAGYFTDGKRFLADVDEWIDRLALPRHRLVRVR
jgi:ribonuclease HII